MRKTRFTETQIVKAIQEHEAGRETEGFIYEEGYRIRRMIYTTNWLERLNKSFRRTLKMRNALPNPQAAITLMGYVAMEMEEGTYSYPITNFKYDSNFNYN